jgi:hypothetical protein
MWRCRCDGPHLGTGSNSARVRALRAECARAAEASLAVVVHNLEQRAVERIAAGDLNEALRHVRALARVADGSR